MEKNNDQILNVQVKDLLNLFTELFTDIIESNTLVNNITIMRLLELDTYAIKLYLFYIKTNILQKNNPIYATNSFCAEGLGWDKKTIVKYKKILVEKRLIEVIRKRNEKGRIRKTFVKINYIQSNKKRMEEHLSKIFNSKISIEKNEEGDENVGTTERYPIHHQKSAKRTSGIQGSVKRVTNTLNKNTSIFVNKYTTQNLNTLNKNTSMPHFHEKILKIWNTQKITIHKSLSPSAKSNITKALSKYSEDQLIESIENYGKIYHSDKYYYNHKWNLSDFLARGLSKTGQMESKGFLQFLSSEDPFRKFAKNRGSPSNELRSQFKPLTELYDGKNILDTNRQTYYGFSLHEVKNPGIRKIDIDDLINNNHEFSFSDFYDLELVIAHILFNRKQQGCSDDLGKYMKVWLNVKDNFRKRARKRIKDLYS